MTIGSSINFGSKGFFGIIRDDRLSFESGLSNH